MGILESFLDTRITCLMYDGRYIVGILRSYDKFHNLTLERAYELLIFGKYIARSNLGVQVIRGENIVLFATTSNESNLKDKKLVDFNELVRLKAEETKDKV